MTIAAREICIPLTAPRDWQAALAGIPHGIAHTWPYCYAMHLSTGYSTFLYCFEAGDVRVVCPIAERTFRGHCDIVTPYGFSGFSGNGRLAGFPSLWKRFAKRRGYVCGYIGLNPLFDDPSYTDPGDVYQHNIVYVLDLSRREADLEAGFSESRARRLKQWAKSGTTVTTDRKLTSEFFLANYRDFFQRKSAAAVYRFSPATIEFLFQQPNVLLFGAGCGDRIESVSVFGYTDHCADYLFNVCHPEAKQHGAGLLWAGIRHLQGLGVPVLNLGGGVRPNDSVAEFKRRFGARPLPLRAAKHVYAPALYADLCGGASATAAEMTGYFPPYRASPAAN